MAGQDIVVIGASAGGVEALIRLVGGLRTGLPAAIFVVLHLPPTVDSKLPEILSHHSLLPAAHARHGERIRAGRIYVGPPNVHLIVDHGFVRLRQGPRENRVRPAADVLFRTAARSYRERVVGVVLSGVLDDGTAGLQIVKHFGGTTVVQDPSDATVVGMPSSALQRVEVDHCLPANEIGYLLSKLAPVRKPAAEVAFVEELGMGTRAGQDHWNPDDQKLGAESGPPTVFTCPDCHGNLWEIEDGEAIAFRCRVGHQFAPETLLTGITDEVEDALWNAVRALQEKADLARRLGSQAR